jgi:hypothetical protein
MLEVKIPKEINRYENKLIGPFSGRQALCIACMGAINIATFKLCISFLPRDIVLMICTMISIPWGLLGWVKIYGMHFEKFFLSVAKNMILAPKVRKYKTENYYESIKKETDKLIKEELAQQELLAFKNDKSKKKPKKIKYKKSKEAYK